MVGDDSAPVAPAPAQRLVASVELARATPVQLKLQVQFPVELARGAGEAIRQGQDPVAVFAALLGGCHFARVELAPEPPKEAGGGPGIAVARALPPLPRPGTPLRV